MTSPDLQRSAKGATLADAIEIAARAHAGQTDKLGGMPYALHPLRVMNRVEGEHAKMAAVLHDVVEDTPVTADDLRRAGFPAAVLAGVLAVTRQKGESYADFVVRAKADPIGRQVKLADLEDNFNLPRALVRADRLEHDLARLRRYVLSYKFLKDELPEPAYRAAMGGE